MVAENTPIPCKFCGKLCKNHQALCGHLRFCKNRFKTMIIRFIDEDLWIRGNRIMVELIQNKIMDEHFETIVPTKEMKKAYFIGITSVSKEYGKNIITKAEWGIPNQFDSIADPTTEVYEV